MTNQDAQTKSQKTFQQTFKADRNWGFEYLITCVPSCYTVKLLHIRAGCQGGFQFHHFKIECGLVLSGKLEVSITNGSVGKLFVLSANDFFFFPNGLVHREKALDDTFILETSTPHFNDRVRFDHIINPENTLPSTQVSDVLTIEKNSDLAYLEQFGFRPISNRDIPFITFVSLHCMQSFHNI